MIKKKTLPNLSFEELAALEEKFSVTLGGPSGFRLDEKAPRVRMRSGVADKAAKKPLRKAAKLSGAKPAAAKATAKR